MGADNSKPHHDRHVGPWANFSENFLKNLNEGDLIEFNRGTYCHWAMYSEHGQVVHFNPKDSEEKMGPLQFEAFVPGAVTQDSLNKVAGASNVRVNNKPGHEEERTISEVREIRNILLNKPGFFYCLAHFNCENFVSYLKFQDSASSAQMDTLKVGWTLMKPSPSLLPLPGFKMPGPSDMMMNLMEMRRPNKEKMKELPMLQWNENRIKSARGEIPDHFIEKSIQNAKSWF